MNSVQPSESLSCPAEFRQRPPPIALSEVCWPGFSLLVYMQMRGGKKVPMTRQSGGGLHRSLLWSLCRRWSWTYTQLGNSNSTSANKKHRMKNILASLLPIISYTVQYDRNKCQADLSTKYKKHYITTLDLHSNRNHGIDCHLITAKKRRKQNVVNVINVTRYTCT